MSRILMGALTLTLVLSACGSGGDFGSNGTKEALRFTTSNLPTAFSGETYTQELQVAGGVNPYTLTVVRGELPPGVTLRGRTLSGTPTKNGRYEFTVEASDASLSSRSQVLAVTVETLPPVRLDPVFPTTALKADTRVPLRLNYPRATRAARFQWRMPNGVTVTRVESGEGRPIMLWKQSGNLLTLDLGFPNIPKSGATVALIGLQFAQSTTITAPQVGFEARDAEGKVVGASALPPLTPPAAPATTPAAPTTPATPAAPTTPTTPTAPATPTTPTTPTNPEQGVPPTPPSGTPPSLPTPPAPTPPTGGGS